MQKISEDDRVLEVLKDNSRLNSTGTDDDLAVDIQDAIDRDISLSLVANNIMISVENDIVTLTGEVYRDYEKMAIGDIASIFAGDNNVNNYLRVSHGARLIR